MTLVESLLLSDECLGLQSHLVDLFAVYLLNRLFSRHHCICCLLLRLQLLLTFAFDIAEELFGAQVSNLLMRHLSTSFTFFVRLLSLYIILIIVLVQTLSEFLLKLFEDFLGLLSA